MKRTNVASGGSSPLLNHLPMEMVSASLVPQNNVGEEARPAGICLPTDVFSLPVYLASTSLNCGHCYQHVDGTAVSRECDPRGCFSLSREGCCKSGRPTFTTSRRPKANASPPHRPQAIRDSTYIVEKQQCLEKGDNCSHCDSSRAWMLMLH